MISIEETTVKLQVDDLELGKRLAALITIAADVQLQQDLSQAIFNDLMLQNVVDEDHEWIGHPPQVIHCSFTLPIFP